MTDIYDKAKVEIFTSSICPHCPKALEIAEDIKKEREDVIVEEISVTTPYGRLEVERLGITAVPTTIIRGPAHPQPIGFKGLIPKDRLMEAIDISLGIREGQEKQSFIENIKNKFRK